MTWQNPSPPLLCRYRCQSCGNRVKSRFLQKHLSGTTDMDEAYRMLATLCIQACGHGQAVCWSSNWASQLRRFSWLLVLEYLTNCWCLCILYMYCPFLWCPTMWSSAAVVCPSYAKFRWVTVAFYQLKTVRSVSSLLPARFSDLPV